MEASYAVTSFLGGEISKFAQGRFDRPDYRISLNVCFNALPVEIGPWCRRPGTMFVGTTRGGNPGRAAEFDFEDSAPYTTEWTDGHLRFRAAGTFGNGFTAGNPATTNDSVTVSSISIANPAVATLATAVTWATGDEGFFSGLGTSCPLLQNRRFTLTKVDTTHFSLADAITGASIDGSTLGVSGLAATATLNHVLDFASSYIGGAWSSGTMRIVPAETETEFVAFTLNNLFPPYAISVNAEPTMTAYAEFVFSQATFLDGPYLDPPTTGVQVTPTGTSGIVELSLSFAAWNPVTAYADGDFVSSGSANYESLTDQNVGTAITCTFSNGSASISATNSFTANQQVSFFANPNGSTPGALPSNLTQGSVYYVLSSGLSGSAFEVSATSGGTAIIMSGAGTGTLTVALAPASMPSMWSPIAAAIAINNGQGFLQTDIGRLVRLFSEPPLWSGAASYSENEIVSYNPSGLQGETTYWSSLVSSNVNNPPGANDSSWQILEQGGTSSPALWSWGKITALINFISGTISGVAQVGNMTAGGGLSAAFNGTTDQSSASSAASTNGNFTAYVGQNFTGCSPAGFAIASATIFPSTDQGIANISWAEWNASATVTAYLYGSNSLPSSATNGTLLGSVIVGTLTPSSSQHTSLGTAAITITSDDLTDTWAYVWVTFVLTINSGTYNGVSADFYAAQIEFVNAAGTGVSANGVNVEILGAPLLYTNSIRTWRLGVYSGTTGYPTCGTCTSGRLWLAGAVPKRFDAAVADGITSDALGVTVNFAPTDQYGNVTDDSAIDYTFNFPRANPILWMEPDQQGIICGTLGGQILIFPPTAASFSPNNIDARPIPGPGAANVEVKRTEHTYIYVQRYSVKLMEYFADIFSGKFTAPNLADKAQHITRNGIAELAYCYSATPIIWGRDNNGNLFGCTYKRDTLMTSQGPTYYGWHRHRLGSNRVLTSLTAGPSIGGSLDAVTMVTNQTSANDPQFNINHVETITDALDELATLAQSWYLDDALSPSSTVSSNSPVSYSAWAAGTTYAQGNTVSYANNTYTSLTNSNLGNVPATSTANWLLTNAAPYGGLTLNGLWHLNGEVVAVSAGGLDCGNYLVLNGSIFVPYGDGISGGTGGGQFTATYAASLASNQIVVGFPYNSDGQIVRPLAPPDTGARNGPALGKLRRDHQVAILFNNLGMSNTTSGNAQPGGQSALSIGRSFGKLKPVMINGGTTKKDATGLPANQLTTFSGVWTDSVPDDSTYDGMICWRANRTQPANIVALEPFLATQDK